MLLKYKYSTTFKIILILLVSVSFGQNGKVDYTGQVKDSYVINGQEYIPGSNGDLLMYVNVWGHVKNPGTYLVYEGIDIMTLISLAGGPQSGANLSRIRLINSKSSKEQNINLNNYLDGNGGAPIAINPHDTIYIKESATSYLISKANFFPIILQLINLIYTVSIPR